MKNKMSKQTKALLSNSKSANDRHLLILEGVCPDCKKKLVIKDYPFKRHGLFCEKCEKVKKYLD